MCLSVQCGLASTLAYAQQTRRCTLWSMVRAPLSSTLNLVPPTLPFLFLHCLACRKAPTHNHQNKHAHYPVSLSAAYIAADVEADFTMHLGRSGEAYFVGEDEVVGECTGFVPSVVCHLQRHSIFVMVTLDAAAPST